MDSSQNRNLLGSSGPPTPIWGNRKLLFAATAIFIAIGVASVIFLTEPLARMWTPADGGKETPIAAPAAADVAQIILLTLGGVVGIIGVALSLSRHGEEVRDAARDQARLDDERSKETVRQLELEEQGKVDVERELRARFVSLIRLMSESDGPSSRVAALLGLGALADDWSNIGRPEEVQVCVDVITHELRGSFADPDGDDEVLRSAINDACIAILKTHLIEGARHSWGECAISLRGISVSSLVDLSEIRIFGTGSIDLSGATLLGGGRILLYGSRISGHGRVNLAKMNICDDGKLDLSKSQLDEQSGVNAFELALKGDGLLDLSGVELKDDSRISLGSADLTDRSCATFSKLKVSQRAKVSLAKVKIRRQGRLLMAAGKFRDQSNISFSQAAVSNNGLIDMSEARTAGSAILHLGGVTLRNSARLDLSRAVLSEVSSLRAQALTLFDKAKASFSQGELDGSAVIDCAGLGVSDTSSVGMRELVVGEGCVVRLVDAKVIDNGILDLSRLRDGSDKAFELTGVSTDGEGRVIRPRMH